MTEHRHHDDDTVIIKPMSFAGTILLSAGAGLAAGMLICWLFTCGADDADTEIADELAISSAKVSASVELVESTFS